MIEPIKETQVILGQKTQVFSSSKLGSFFGAIAKALGLACDIKLENSKIVCLPNSQYRKLLRNSVAQSSPISEQAIQNILKSVMENTAGNHNIVTDVNSITRKMELTELFSYVEPFEEDAEAIRFNEKLKAFLTEKVSQNTSLDRVVIEFLQSNKDDRVPFVRFLSRLHENRKSEPSWIRTFTDKFSHILAVKSAESVKGTSSKAERNTLRTPTDITVDLLAWIKKSNHPERHQIAFEIQSLFLNHATTQKEVLALLNGLEAHFPESELALKCADLKKQLITTPHRTLLVDNIYGRAFDSAFVNALVKNPPAEVCEAMSQMSQGLGQYLSQLKLTVEQRRDMNLMVQETLAKEDPRFWFPAIPDLEKIKGSNTDHLTLLIDYLMKPKVTGVEAISIPYLMVKVSIALRGIAASPPWMNSADTFYGSTISPQVHGIRDYRKGKKMDTRGAGINLHYQPSIANEEWMAPSERPSTVRKPNWNSTEATDSAKKSLDKMLNQGIPFASGISGSTNIFLFAWEYFNGKNPIDPKAAFLGALMFLVYDGGHSMHEPLWAASTLNQRLNLGFDIGSTPNVEDFVSDYEKFQNMYEPGLREKIGNAFQQAFTQVTDYYEQHSYYAKPKTNKKETA